MKNNRNIIVFLIFILLIIVTLFVIKFINNGKPKIENFKIDDMEIKINETLPIKYELDNKNYVITWSVTDDSIAKIFNDEIIGLNYGTTEIIGIINTDNNEIIEQKAKIIVYSGDKNISLNDFYIPEGDILISIGNEYTLPINYSPNNAYIKNISYSIDNDIIHFENNKITALKEGKTILTIKINNIEKKKVIYVTKDNVQTQFIKPINNISFTNDLITLKVNEKKKLDYNINPIDGYIRNIKIESSNENIVSSEDEYIKAINEGEATIKLTINDILSATVNVKVVTPIKDINIIYYPKDLIKEGETTKVVANIIPDNIDYKLFFKSSNQSIISINDFGEIKALREGTADIIITDQDENIKKNITINVLPTIRTINGDGKIFKYTSNNVVIPQKADITFFQKLTEQNIGSLNNNVFTYNDGFKSYKYDISKSILYVDNYSLYMRIYYPPNKDLSNVNTLTFLGGNGEEDFNGYFSKINSDLSIIKSSGIIILVTTKTGSDYNSNAVVLGTEFVKKIVKQKDYVINSVGGFSKGGRPAGEALNKGDYKRLLIFDSYFYNASGKPRLKDVDIIFYSTSGDHLAPQATTTLSELYSYGVKNVTIITNNDSIIKKFNGKYLIINPGSTLGYGHQYNSITISNFFAYACL